jgi:hypothetical protein
MLRVSSMQRCRLFVVFGEIIGNTGGGRFHGLFAFFPVGRADVSMFFMELEGVDHAQGFVGIAPQGQIVDYRMANNAVPIDEKGAAQGYARFEQDAVSAGNAFVEIGHQRILDITDAALFDRGVFPGPVGKLRVYRDAYDFTIFTLKEAVILSKARISEGQTKVKSRG